MLSNSEAGEEKGEGTAREEPKRDKNPPFALVVCVEDDAAEDV